MPLADCRHKFRAEPTSLVTRLSLQYSPRHIRQIEFFAQHSIAAMPDNIFDRLPPLLPLQHLPHVTLASRPPMPTLSPQKLITLICRANRLVAPLLIFSRQRCYRADADEYFRLRCRYWLPPRGFSPVFGFSISDIFAAISDAYWLITFMPLADADYRIFSFFIRRHYCHDYHDLSPP